MLYGGNADGAMDKKRAGCEARPIDRLNGANLRVKMDGAAAPPYPMPV